MMKPTCLLLLLSATAQIAAFSINSSSTSTSTSTSTITNDVTNRRSFFSKVATTTTVATVGVLANNIPAANAASTTNLIQDLETSVTKINGIPELLDQGEWDKVRTILKTPPVNKLWNLGESQNTLSILAKETGEFDLIELKDELSISLQICDQLTYDNAFVYFQPGNGKVKIKEPKDLAVKAVGQIQEAIKLVSN